MTEAQLEAAAFWQSRICLSCETVVDDPERETCHHCDSGDLVTAEMALRCFKLVEQED